MKINKLGYAFFGAMAGIAFIGINHVNAYKLMGGSLSLGYRDFRIYNNFGDYSANDNKTPHRNYPGAIGAVMAGWKAAMEWGSGHYVDGSGDPTQYYIGDGGANFEFIFMGTISSYSNPRPGDNVIFAGRLQRGVLGVCVSYVGHNPPGWYIALNDYYYTWDDGPGYHNLWDIQGIVTHELGHALRLGHTSVRNATMYAYAHGNGIADRSIESDDSAGVQAIYGAKSYAKPEITSLGGSMKPGLMLEINGKNFSRFNEVWFTSGGSRNPVTAVMVPSLNNGTRIVIKVPSGAKPGNVAVKIPGNSHSCLSNVWAFDPTKGSSKKPTLSSISPSRVKNINGGEITLKGNNFYWVSEIKVGNLKYGTGLFKVIDNNTLKFFSPDPPPGLGSLNVVASSASGSSNPLTLTIYPADPPEIVAPKVTWMNRKDHVKGGHKPSHYAILVISGSNKPSVIPGVISLSIGNNFNDLAVCTVSTFDGIGRWETFIPIPPGFGGYSYYLQLIAIDPFNPGKLPVTVSNFTKTYILY